MDSFKPSDLTCSLAIFHLREWRIKITLPSCLVWLNLVKNPFRKHLSMTQISADLLDNIRGQFAQIDSCPVQGPRVFLKMLAAR